LTGVPVDATVTALDAAGNTAAGHRGTVHFASTDGNATLPSDHAFTATHAGSHAFTGGVTFDSTGSQTETATDAASATITGTSAAVSVPSPVPHVTGPSRTSGPWPGGTVVTISGSSFTGATSVTFGGTPATSFTVNSAARITATAPAGTGAVSVTVTTPGGTSDSLSVTCLASPYLTSLTPTSGPMTGGNTVTITGWNLVGATSVRFGATPASSFTVVSPTRIVAVAPPGTGIVQVTVIAPGGTSPALPYVYLPPA